MSLVPYASAIRSLVLTSMLGMLASHASAGTIYFDDFNDPQNIDAGGPYTQTLVGSVPTTRNATFGGTATATWLSGGETGGWGQRDYGDNNVATPTSSNFLPFTPDSSRIYKVEMTVDTTPLGGAGAGGWGESWFTAGFTQAPRNWNGGADAGTLALGQLVRFTSNTVATITYTRSGADLVAAGITHVGWVTDGPGIVNLSGLTQVKIDNFKLTASDPNRTIYNGNGNAGGSVPVDGISPYFGGSMVTVLGNTGSLSRTSFTFSGWNTAADGSGTTYHPGDTFTINADTTLYAQWAPGPDYVWDNGAATNSWNATHANWSGATWSNSATNNAFFTTGASNVNLHSSIVGNAVNVGNSGANFISFGLLDGGGDLTASSLTVQGSGGNGGDYRSNPSLSVNSAVTLSGDAAVGRANLIITGGTFTANRIISAPASADWARLVVSGGTVAATNGVDGSVNTAATFQLDLNGGTLFTPFLKAADRDPSVGGARLNFNGTVIRPIASTASFITLHGGSQNAYVGDGGAIFSTDGYNIGIGANLLASGNGGLTKSGEGTLTLSGVSNFTGGTTVSGGILQMVANGGNCPITGTLTVNSGAMVTTTGDGTGLGFNGEQKITTLNINGGTVSSAGTIHIWNQGGGVNLTGGTLSAAVLQWGDSVVNSIASSTSSVIGGQINIRADNNSPNSSLLQLNVADGAAATDLLISANITESGRPVGATTGGRCGITKTGAGTLRLTGAVQISGVISVEAGTLDFAPSSVSQALGIQVAGGARLNLANAGTTLVKNVYLDGKRLAAGTWGAPGSGAANESPVVSGSGILQITDTDISNRERWKRMKYGQFTHYTYQGFNPDGSWYSSPDYAANSFDPAKYANDLQSMGVEYVIFTAWHSNFNPLFNSAAFDRVGSWLTARHSQRDMLGDMIAAVRAKGIRVLFYTHPNQPIIFDWTTHNNMINDIYGELIDRYGDQIDGLYMDENDPGGNQDYWVDFVRLGQTIRRRNPDLVLIQNFYGNLYCNDVPMGESGPAVANFSKDVSWPSTSAYAQVMSQTWTASVPLGSNAATRSAEGIFRGAVTAACSSTDGGGWAWASGPFPGSIWEQGVLEAMQGAGQLMAPVAESIKSTYPSTSFSFSNTWGGATRSVDDTKEYIHVLWPPSGNTLTLPAPTDGKVFANARLLANGQPVTLVQNGRAVRLTLTGTNTWDANDTVIAMDVVSAGDPYLANNTTPDATYTGSWVYSANRPTSEFCRDVHSTTVNGDFVEYHFNGTDIELVVSCGPNRGTMDIFIDGVFQQSANAADPTDGLRKTIYRGTGLTRGNHTLKVVKTGGSFLSIDAFRATEFIDSADPDVGYQAMTFFNNTDITPNPIGYIEYSDGWLWQQRDRNEYNWDAHWAQWNGCYFNIHFNGTGVQFIGSYDGIIDFYLDDVFVKQVNMRNIGGLARVVGIDIKGLPAGNHVLKGVKAGDTYVHVDAFFVYNGQNSNWSTQTDGTAVGGSYQRSPGFSDAATLRFHGTGIEVLAPHGLAGGTVAATIQSSAYQDYAWQVVNQYAAETQPQSQSFASRNVTFLPEGDYTLALSHNRSFGSIALDALRVYKNRPGSGPALQWGASGGGGSGSWDVNTTANWWDGATATAWYDVGAPDYTAIFGGGSGIVTLASNANVNQLIFNTTGYTLQNGTIHFNGFKPTVTLASNVAVTLASGITGSSGLTKDGAGMLTLTGGNAGSGGITISNGSLVAARSIQDDGIHTLGTGTLTINQGGTLRTTRNWATSSNWNDTSVGAITLNPGGTWSIEAVGMTVRNGLNLNGGSIVGTTANTDWGALHLMSDVVADGKAVSSVGVDTVLSGTRTFTVGSGSQLNYSGVLHNQISISGGVTKNGSGTLVLSGANTYTGATIVSAGSLLVNSSTASASPVTVVSGAILGGTGTVGGPVTIQSGGVLAPGDSGTGLLTGASSVTIHGMLAIQLDGAGCDRLSVTGNLDITNATLDLAVIPGGALQQEYIIASFGSRTGSQFSNVTGLPTGYRIVYGTTSVKLLPSFASWAAGKGLSDTTPDGDPDKDGLPNALEYVLGGNPAQADPGIAPVATVSGGNMVFTFQRADSSETTDLSLIFEASTDLVNWNETYSIGAATASSSSGVTVSENSASADTITVTIPSNSSATKFARLRTTVAP